MNMDPTTKKLLSLADLIKSKNPIAPEDIARRFQKIAKDFLSHSDISLFPLEAFLKLLGVSVVRYLRKDPSPNVAVHAIFEEIIESLSRDESTKRILLSNKVFLPSVLPLVCSSTLHWQCRQNTLELLCNITSLRISIECRMGLLMNYLNYFDQVAQLLYTIGDYDFQVVILELLIRFGVQKDKGIALRFFKHETLAQKFIDIERKLFEPMSRPFLNFLNTSCGPLALVKSIPCIRMKVGEREIYKPSDLGYDQFWVDFNIGTKILRIYCMKDQLTTMKSAKKWDSLMIQAEDILRYQVSKNSGNSCQTLRIDLAKDGYLLFDSTAVSKFPGFTVCIEFDIRLPIGETMKSISLPATPAHNESTEDTQSIKSSIQIRRININTSEPKTGSSKEMDKERIQEKPLDLPIAGPIQSKKVQETSVDLPKTQLKRVQETPPHRMAAKETYLNTVGLTKTAPKPVSAASLDLKDVCKKPEDPNADDISIQTSKSSNTASTANSSKLSRKRKKTTKHWSNKKKRSSSKGGERKKGDLDMDISITEQVMKKQLDSKGEKSILREEKREPDLEISNPSPIFNSTRKSFEAEENELENHSDVTSKKNPLATIKNKPSTKVVEKSLTKKIVEPPISTAIVTTIQETQDSDIGVAIDQNEPNKQPVKETLESPNHSITSSIKSQELLEDNEIAVVALVGQKTKDSFKRETGPPDLDDLSNVVSPVNKSSKSSEKKKKKGLSISGNKDSSYLVPPRPPNNTLNTSNFQEIVSPNALVVTKPTQKRFFKTYEKNKGPSSFFVKPAVSDMGDDKKKKFDIFDPVSSDEDEDHVHGQKTKKPLTSLKKPSAKVGNDTKKKDPKPKTKKTSKKLLPPLSFLDEPAPPSKRSKVVERKKAMKKQSYAKGEKSILRIEKKEKDLENSIASPIFNSTRKSIEADQNELEMFNSCHSDVTSKKDTLVTRKTKPSPLKVKIGLKKRSLTKKFVEPPISTAIVTSIPESQNSEISNKSPIFEVPIDQNEPKSPIFLQNKQPAKESLESPIQSITSSIKSQKYFDDEDNNEPPVDLAKKAHSEVPKSLETPKPNERPSGPKSPQMTSEKVLSPPEPANDENASSEVEKQAQNGKNQEQKIDDVKLIEMTPQVKITPFAKHQHLVSKNDEDNKRDKHSSVQESTVEKPLLHTPKNGRSVEVISRNSLQNDMTPITRNPRTPLSMKNRLIQQSRRIQTAQNNDRNHGVEGLKEIIRDCVTEVVDDSLKNAKKAVHAVIQEQIKEYIKEEIQVAVQEAIAESTLKETFKEYVKEEIKVAVEAMKSIWE